MAIGVRRSLGLDARAFAAASRAALAWPLADEAELWIARPEREAMVLGAFQRAGAAGQAPVFRRGSGGPTVRVGSGTLWVALLLPRVDALTACDEARILNRYARPLLRALTKSGALAHFFGRDWIAVKHRPAAWIGFAHEQASGRVVVEAFVARATPFDAGQRAAYLGKEPGTLQAIVGAPVEEARLVDATVEAFSSAYARAAVDLGEVPAAADDERVAAEPPWAATVDEAIGPIGAGPDARGVFRVGGDLLVSRDALAALESALSGTPDEEVGARVDAILGAPGVAIDGVRSLTSVRDVVLAARGRG